MKITIVNTSDSRGGAAIAALRLFKVLYRKLPETRMFVREKFTDNTGITGLNRSFIQRCKIQWFFLLERFRFIPRAKNKESWFSVSPADFGQCIEQYPEIRNADIIHLHWVQMGFLSTGSIRRIIKTGKPIVWTLHDMWAFTGGCHYPGDCVNYMKECGNCYFLKSPGKNDLTQKHFKKKLRLFANSNISFIAVSNWMAESARKSSLIGKGKITVLPNPIDTEIYKPADKLLVRDELGLPRDKFLILSGAANLQDKRKGFMYLIEAFEKMKQTDPGISEKFGLITFGKLSDVENPAVPIYPQSYLKDDSAIAKLYQAADVFVLPSLEDNLPSTVMESIACGTAVVAFNIGGIPDMIEHKVNGYLAELKNTDDLISGINWVKNHPEIDQL